VPRTDPVDLSRDQAGDRGVAAAAVARSSSATASFAAELIRVAWDAGLVPPDRPQVFGYAESHRPRASACADLPEAHRWWGSQTSTLVGGVVEQAALLDGVAGGLADGGYAVRRYRSLRSTSRVLDAVHPADDAYLQLHVTEDGAATLAVKVGPCARRLQVDPGPPYEVER